MGFLFFCQRKVVLKTVFGDFLHRKCIKFHNTIDKYGES